MKADFFYRHAWGRLLFRGIQKSGVLRPAAAFLHTRASGVLIGRVIRENNIDMSAFSGQEYASFADFFARKKTDTLFDAEPEALISPCDGLLSAFTVDERTELHMKESVYTLSDLLPDADTAASFHRGLALILRLQASDYHHFCAFDDMEITETRFLEGELHSVQPIALRSVPVFRLNRRWWSVLETEHFGKAAQIELGAMLVGGVHFACERGRLRRGDEMGNFELAGSTIILLLTEDVRTRLRLEEEYLPVLDSGLELPVRMGQRIGKIQD